MCVMLLWQRLITVDTRSVMLGIASRENIFHHHEQVVYCSIGMLVVSTEAPQTTAFKSCRIRGVSGRISYPPRAPLGTFTRHRSPLSRLHCIDITRRAPPQRQEQEPRAVQQQQQEQGERRRGYAGRERGAAFGRGDGEIVVSARFFSAGPGRTGQ